MSPMLDPEAWAVDAMSLSWSNLLFYAYPPTILLIGCAEQNKDRDKLPCPAGSPSMGPGTICSILLNAIEHRPADKVEVTRVSKLAIPTRERALELD